MASIPLDFAETERNRIVNGLCKAGGYKAQILESYQQEGPGGSPMMLVRMIPNPETKAQFAKRYIAEWVKNQIADAERADDVAAIAPRTRPAIT